MYRIELRMEFDVDVRKLHSAVELDNEGYISSSFSRGRINAHAESGNLMTLLRTVDDFISCLQVAERTMKNSSPRGSPPPPPS